MLHGKDMKETLMSFIPQNKVVQLSALRTKHLGFLSLCIMYYVWVTLLASWPKNIFIGNLYPTIPYGGLILAVSILATVLFIYRLRKKWVVYGAIAGVITLMIMFTVLFINPNASWLWLAIGVGVALGGVHTSLIIPFVFTLNNTEKFYVTALGTTMVQGVMLYKKCTVIEGYLNFADRLFEMLLLLFIIVTIIVLKRYFITIEQEPDDTTRINSRIYLIWIFNGVYVAISLGVIRGFLACAVDLYGNQIYLTHYFGGLAGCLAYVALYTFFKKAIILVGNVTFGCIALGILCYAFADLLPVMALCFSILTGIGCGMGMINVFYVITVVAKKYNSIRYLRLSILWIGTGGGIVSLILNIVLRSIDNRGLMIVASMISATFLLLFMLLSPLLSEGTYYNDWAKSSEEMDIDIKPCSIYEQYHLTKRETEVIKLLLEGYTLRQIAAILSLAYSTINTYYTSAYRKLNINSRVQLLLLFKEYEKP